MIDQILPAVTGLSRHSDLARYLHRRLPMQNYAEEKLGYGPEIDGRLKNRQN